MHGTDENPPVFHFAGKASNFIYVKPPQGFTSQATLAMQAKPVKEPAQLK
jgi:hypothetical protein